MPASAAGASLFKSLPTPGAVTPGDDYKERLVKYIPAESVAFYTFTDKLVASQYGLDSTALAATQGAPATAMLLAWLLFGLGVVGTPIYLYRQRKPNQPWRLHAGISTLAFILWAYTLGGSLFVILGWYEVFVAGLLAPIFTFVAGFVEPRPR